MHSRFIFFFFLFTALCLACTGASDGEASPGPEPAVEFKGAFKSLTIKKRGVPDRVFVPVYGQEGLRAFTLNGTDFSVRKDSTGRIVAIDGAGVQDSLAYSRGMLVYVYHGAEGVEEEWTLTEAGQYEYYKKRFPTLEGFKKPLETRLHEWKGGQMKRLVTNVLKEDGQYAFETEIFTYSDWEKNPLLAFLKEHFPIPLGFAPHLILEDKPETSETFFFDKKRVRYGFEADAQGRFVRLLIETNKAFEEDWKLFEEYTVSYE